MPGPARTGVLIYAKNLLSVSVFYEQVLGAEVLHADDEHRVLQTPDVQLIIHAIREPVVRGQCPRGALRLDGTGRDVASTM